jgi:hypothetical protein
VRRGLDSCGSGYGLQAGDHYGANGEIIISKGKTVVIRGKSGSNTTEPAARQGKAWPQTSPLVAPRGAQATGPFGAYVRRAGLPTFMSSS